MIHIALTIALAASLQARYDAARAIVESSRDARAVAAARVEIAVVEREDGRPRAVAPRTQRLPPTWTFVRSPNRRDAALTRRLGTAVERFRGTAAVWVHDLRTGRAAGWNAEGAMPAASTVKLAVIAAALHSRRRDLRYDAQQIAAWSSNLAANRIVEQLGYVRVSVAMRALGMRHSTYPGPYRVGTALGSFHTRVTTARDLGRAMFFLQAAALGRRSYLTRAQARVALLWLRRSLPAGENVGLLRPWLRSVPLAQKNGWTSDTRLTAAIVYRTRGPLIVVVAAWRDGLKRYEARALARDVLRAAT